MKIAIIGTGNVGGALATKWAASGHKIFLGVKDLNNFKGQGLLTNSNTEACTIKDAVLQASVILLATPASATIAVTKGLGDTEGKVIIDAMNIFNGNGPEGYSNTSDAILANTQTDDVVKCFNTTGYSNMINPEYGGVATDMFMAGDSKEGKKIASELASDAGFGACYDAGGNDKFLLMEQFGSFWINLAMFQGQGRDIAFKLLKR